MLILEDIQTFYGESQALFGISLEIKEAEVVTLLGRNGMGKSTVIKSICGLMPIRKGRISLVDREIQTLQSFQIARLGIGLVPEGRQIFFNLTAKENLLAVRANYTRKPSPYRLADVLEIFPRLEERLSHFGNQLSGGEQQMLAIARALMINPKLLILDEATEGLAPLVRKEIWKAIESLKSSGMSILIVDKNLRTLMDLAQRHYIMEKGEIAWSGTSDSLRAHPELQARYLGV